MPKRFGKQTMRIRRGMRQTIGGLAKHGLLSGDVQNVFADLGFPPDEAGKLLAEADERIEREREQRRSED